MNNQNNNFEMMWCLALNFVVALTFSTFSVSANQLAEVIKLSEQRKVAPLIPRSYFMQSKPYQDASLSPDGRYMSYIQIKPKHSELWLLNIKQNVHRMLFSNKDMQDAHWSSDSQFLFVENNQGLMGVSIKPDAFPLLIAKIDSSRDQYFYAVDSSQNQAVILSEKDYKKHVHQLVRLSSDGVKYILYTSQQRILDFLVDENGQLSFIKHKSTEWADLYDVRGAKPKLIKHCGFYDNCSLQRYNPQSNTLLVKARFEQDLMSLFAINLDTLKTTMLHQDPQGQFNLATVNYDVKGDPRLALYQDHYVSQYAIDSQTQQQLDNFRTHLDKFTQNDRVWTFKPSANFAVWLAFDNSPNQAIREVYLFNQLSAQVTKPLAHLNDPAQSETPRIQQQHLAFKVAVDYQTSDGMQQFGYLTLPLGKKISDVPLVVVPHGGPWSRATGYYYSFGQLLANRGYAVFEPNFRSSTGMGKHYVLSANQDFGDGRVQQDILDGLEFVLSKGVGDKNRLAIYGHSFGGFSTLTALAFSPDLFKVGIAGAPPTDIGQSVIKLSNQQQNDRQHLRLLVLNELLGNPDDTEAMQRLHQKSPDAHWQKITKPLYILAGGQDNKVSIARIKDFGIRLEQANKPFSLLVDEKEGHSFQHDIAKEAYAYVLEKALATHLNTEYQHDVSDNLRRYLKRNIVIDKNALLPD